MNIVPCLCAARSEKHLSNSINCWCCLIIWLLLFLSSISSGAARPLVLDCFGFYTAKLWILSWRISYYTCCGQSIIVVYINSGVFLSGSKYGRSIQGLIRTCGPHTIEWWRLQMSFKRRITIVRNLTCNLYLGTIAHCFHRDS